MFKQAQEESDGQTGARRVRKTNRRVKGQMVKQAWEGSDGQTGAGRVKTDRQAAVLAAEKFKN